MNISDLPENQYVRLGNDYVVAQGSDLVVYTPNEMEDWHVREYRKTAVLFYGRKYFVDSKFAEQDRVCYMLKYWPDSLTDRPAMVINYDEVYVAQRDALIKRERQIDREAWFIMLLLPIAGFFPQKIKDLLEGTYGLNIYLATTISLWLEYAGALFAGILIIINLFANGFTLHPLLTLPVLVATIIVSMLDAFVRYSSLYLKDPSVAYGFYEWVLYLKNDLT